MKGATSVVTPCGKATADEVADFFVEKVQKVAIKVQDAPAPKIRLRDPSAPELRYFKQVSQHEVAEAMAAV